MQDYKREIRLIADQIVKNYDPQRIILFGSAARNEFTENSDIDILVVKETEKNKFERMCELRRLLEYSIPLDLIVYTPEEIEYAAQKGNDFIKTIFSEGVVLYE